MKKLIAALEQAGQTQSLQQVDNMVEFCRGDLAQAQAFKKILTHSLDQVCIQFPDDDDDDSDNN